MKWSKFLSGLELALKSKTTYAFGGFGFPLNNANKKRLLNNSGNSGDKKIRDGINAGNKNTFAFDCVCLPKGILWGWNGDTNKNYGGAVYMANGVPDVNADVMMTKAHVDYLSTDFSKIKVGAFVGMKGHMGIYVGNGEVIEATTKWTGDVLKSKLSDRKWVNWGMSKYIDYSELDKPKPAPTPKPEPKPNEEKVGDTVKVNGRLFTSSNGSVRGITNHKNKEAKIERIIKTAKHPYYVKGKGISGWADLSHFGKVETTPKPIAKGDKVRLLKAISYDTGKKFNKWRSTYDVISVNGKRVVIGVGNKITAPVHKDNLEKIS